MKLKRLLASILAGAMVFSTMSFTVFADSTYVAKVGSVEYTVDSDNLDLEESAPAEIVVATVNGEEFTSLQDAIEVAQTGDTIIITNDFNLDTIVTVANGKKITLDLNGKTITGTDNTEKNFSLIDNRGDLTITGNGKMMLTATFNSGWSRYSAVLANNPGGKLTIENGTFEHLGGTDMAYAIDNLTNGKGTYAETIINGGIIKSTYRGIRQFLNGVEAQNVLTVNGGTVEGANKSIWMQDPSKNANTGTLTVGEAATLNGDVYLTVTEGSTEWPVEVSIARSAVNGQVLTNGNEPAGYELLEADGVYTLIEAPAEEIALPTATVTSIENDDLTFALNFKADEASEEQLNYYGDWYADFVLTINKDVIFNANGGADGYLSGQYDTWSENWVNVPFEDVTVKAGEPLKIMEYAAKLMGQSGLKLTYNDVYNSVEDFDCGVFFEEEFLQENPDLEVTLELRMYNNEDENESYVIGETYSFKVEEPAEDINVLTRVKYYADYMPVSFYPENIVLYRLGLYAAAESDSYDEYGFEVTVEGQDPVLIKAEKYSSALNIVVKDGVDKFVASDFNTNGGNNVCIFGQTIAFKDDALGDGKIIYRPYVKKDGNVYFGTAYTAPNIYKNK